MTIGVVGAIENQGKSDMADAGTLSKSLGRRDQCGLKVSMRIMRRLGGSGDGRNILNDLVPGQNVSKRMETGDEDGEEQYPTLSLPSRRAGGFGFERSH
jgi:hypothetical protein